MDARDRAALARAPLFKTAEPNVLAELAESASVRDYRRGELIFRQGDAADAIFVVVEGCVALYRQPENFEQVVVAVLTDGEAYFEPSMFAAGGYSVFAETVSCARVLRLDGASVRGAMLRWPRLAFDLLNASSGANNALIEQVEHLRTRSVSQRIAAFFLRQLASTGEAATFALPYNKALIAKLLGAKSETFSRSLALLREEGVEIRRNSVTIRDVDRLARYVQTPIGDKLHERKPVPTRFASLRKRRTFDHGLVREWRKALSAGDPISLLLIDVGQARRPAEARVSPFNRGLLTAVGDDISREADRTGKFMVHHNDDIFAVAAPKTGHGEALTLAERILTTIESSAMRRASEAAPSIVPAIGMATIVPSARDRIEKIVCYADIALYQSKTLGRGPICSFHDEPSCETAKCSPSGGVRIPVIGSSHCAECRRYAPCA